MKILNILVICFLALSCSATKNLMNKYSDSDCQENKISVAVYELGKKGEEEGLPLKYINKCLQSYPVKYKKNKIFKHYKNGLKKYCHKSVWEHEAQNLGEKGEEYTKLLPKIKVCQLQNITSAQNGLKRGHKLGLKRFCNKDLWFKEGFDLGSKADDFNLHDQVIRVCTINRVRDAQSGLQKGYKKGIKHFCSSINWGDEAVAHVQRGIEFQKLYAVAQKCVVHGVDKNAVIKARNQYIRGQKSYCKLENAFDFGLKNKEYNLAVCPVESQETLRLQYLSGQKAQSPKP